MAPPIVTRIGFGGTVLDGDPGNAAGPLDDNGLIPLSQLPPAALTAKVLVANQAARFALTSADVQAGDLVRQTDTGRLYLVIDDTQLSGAGGYQDLDEASLAALATHAAGSGVHAIAATTGLQAALDAKAAATDATISGFLAHGIRYLAGTPANGASTSRWESGGGTSNRFEKNVPSGGLYAWNVAATTLACLDAGGFNFYAPLILNGTPASAGASVRNIHGNGTTDRIYHNVPAGGYHVWDIDGTDVTYIGGEGLVLLNRPFTMNGSSGSAGNSVRNIHGGGGSSDFILNVPSAGGIALTQNGTTILGFDSAKAATVDATFGASLATALGVGFIGCSLSYSTTQQIGTSFTELSIDTENADPNGMHTSTNTYATVQTGHGGTWEIEAIVVASLIPGTDTHGSDNRHIPEIEIYKNGSTSLRTSRGGILSPGTFVGTNPAECLTVGIITSLAAGDTIRIRARESLSSGANYKFQLVELKMKRLGA